MCGGTLKFKGKVLPPLPLTDTSNMGVLVQKKKKLAAGPKFFFFTKKWGQQGFPRDFLVGGGALFSQGGGQWGALKIPPPKIAGKLLKNKKQNKKIQCAEGPQNFWDSMILVRILTKVRIF